MVTHFLYHGYAGRRRARGRRRRAVRGCRLELDRARGYRRCRPTPRARGAMFGYWLHVLILLTFLNYLPYSKHIHLLGALPNIFARNRSERRMDLPKLNLEDENAVGRRQVRAVLVEVAARHLRVHRVRALLELLPGVQHRQEPVADAARPRHPLRDARSRRSSRDKIAELENDGRAARGVRAAQRLDDADHPHPDLAFAKRPARRARRPSSRRCRR